MLETDTAPGTQNTTVYLKDYQPPLFTVRRVNLDFQLADTTRVTAVCEIERTGEHQESLRLDGENLVLIELKLAGQVLDQTAYQVDDAGLTIFSVPDQFVLHVVTETKPKQNTELSGLYQSSGNFCTQCEAEGFRRITYFLDRPDVLAEYEVTLHASKQDYPVLLSNGNPVARGDNSNGSHWARWHDPHPKPSYLFALVAGDLESIDDQFTTRSGREVSLHVYTQAHNIDNCQHAMDSLKKAMLWDEQVYGREYDLDVYNIVAVDDFNMGAMENKGLNIFNSQYVLAHPQTATDTDFQNIESVIGHEYFHNWSGNRVTCRDWFQLSLKEGFTVFRDQEFSADMGSRAVKRIRDVQRLRTYQFKEDAGPMAHPVRPSSYQEINNFYTVTIYDKGAELIRMLYALVGAGGFRAATDLYFQRYDGQAVTTEDFVQCVEQANNTNLEQFRLWYTQAGTPELNVEQQYDSNQGRLTLNIGQRCPATPGQPHKQAMPIPISAVLIDPQGETVEARELVLTDTHQKFDFEDLAAQPVVSFLRDFSAPVKVNFAQSNQELAHLVEYDDNGFTRWEALQRLSLNILLPAIQGSAEEFDPPAYQALLSALHGLSNYAQGDLAMLAEMLSLPQLDYVAELCQPIDPQRVARLHDQLQRMLAVDLQINLHALYLKCAKQSSEFSLSAEAMAQRALKNTTLKLLLRCDEARFYELAEDQYQQASNMTDRLAAFSALLHSEYANKQAMIADFYNTWQHDPLVMDKWFALQASIPQMEILAAVYELTRHPGFSIKNPNKVRSLIGTFTTNMRAFHRSDGAGYQFVADMVIQLDAINPQMGARLAASLSNWRAYCDPYATAMREQLQRVANTASLSKDVREIVSKALDSS